MRKVLKWVGIVIVGLIVLLAVAFGGLAVYANSAFKARQANRPLYPISADTSPEGLARGKYLLEQAMDCTHACHSPENGAPLSGVVENINQGPIQAVFAVPNLTPDETGLKNWTDAEIARAIREGIDKDEVEMVIMPSYNYHALSDADVAAIIGYLRGLEPVKHEIPPLQANLAAKILISLGLMGQKTPQTPITAPVVAPQIGTVEYGAYLMKLGACSDCHGANYAGGPMPFAAAGDPPSANLTPGGELVGWSAQDFIKAVREGIRPSGTKLSEAMPRYQTTDEDLTAIYSYLKTLPAAQPAR